MSAQATYVTLIQAALDPPPVPEAPPSQLGRIPSDMFADHFANVMVRATETNRPILRMYDVRMRERWWVETASPEAKTGDIGIFDPGLMASVTTILSVAPLGYMDYRAEKKAFFYVLCRTIYTKLVELTGELDAADADAIAGIPRNPLEGVVAKLNLNASKAPASAKRPLDFSSNPDPYRANTRGAPDTSLAATDHSFFRFDRVLPIVTDPSPPAPVPTFCVGCGSEDHQLYQCRNFRSDLFDRREHALYPLGASKAICLAYNHRGGSGRNCNREHMCLLCGSKSHSGYQHRTPA